MEEIWKNIIGYEKSYQVSNLGRIRTLDRFIKNEGNYAGGYFYKSKILKPSKNKKGYIIASLTQNGINNKFKVHRLVASAFLENYNNLPQVNHKNGNKEDNKVDNLEWCNNLYNMQHSWQTGIRVYKVNIDTVNKIRYSYTQENLNLDELVLKFNVTKTIIKNIITYKTWKFI